MNTEERYRACVDALKDYADGASPMSLSVCRAVWIQASLPL